MANSPEPSAIGRNWASQPNVHRFGHAAMATTFEIVVQHAEPVYARQAADAAFDELDRIERELSRYIENTDIARINMLVGEQPLLLGLDTFACLTTAARVSAETGGAFDVTAGFLVDCWLGPDRKPKTPSAEELAYARSHTGMSSLELDEESYTVTLMSSPVRVDLGGIGKGYALDRMAAMLDEWGVSRVLIHGGYSSVLAAAAPEALAGWPVTLSDPRDRRRTLARLDLAQVAVGGSGFKRGLHIIDPRAGKPVEGTIATWAIAPDAATADALSTAFTVMTTSEVTDYCEKRGDVRALLMRVGKDDSVGMIAAGQWEPEQLVY